jgi:hypothetical protein
MYVCDMSSYQISSGSLELLTAIKPITVEHFCLAVILLMVVILGLSNTEAICAHHYFTFYKKCHVSTPKVNVAGASQVRLSSC